MTAPRLELIIGEIASRLTLVDGTGEYYFRIGENVRRGQLEFNEAQLPACSVFLNPRTRDIDRNMRARIRASITIHARVMREERTDPEVTAIRLLADIQRAVESGDSTLNRMLTEQMTWERDEIVYPENAGRIVAVEVDYQIPHIRYYGDPTK